MKDKSKLGYIAISEEAKNEYFIKQQFTGETNDIPQKFPKDLGAAHPFNFEDLEKLYKKNGLVSGAVNKISENIVGDFTIKAQNENSQALIDSFVNDSAFTIAMRVWIREAVLKGNGFMELDLMNSQVRVMNANNMYVRRNNKGKVLEYIQYTGDLNKFNKNSKKTIVFKPEQIAHLTLNKIPNDPYGIGYIYPSERVIENIVLEEQDKQKLIARKAGAPLHVKIGVPGQSVQGSDIDEFSDKLKFMNNRTEWATDGNVEMKVIEFGDIGKNLTESLGYNIEQFATGVEIPVVLLGKSNVPEGLAKVQLEAFQRKIQSIRAQVENVIRDKVFRQLLRYNKLDEVLNFQWNLPGEDEINQRILSIQSILGTMGISENMRRGLEIELAKLLDIEELVKVLPEPEEGLQDKNKEAEAESEIQQPEVPGAKPNAKEEQEVIIEEKVEDESEEEINVDSFELDVRQTLQRVVTNNNIIEQIKIKEEMERKESGEMSIQEFVNLKELAGFNYSDYLIKILKKLRVDTFEQLRAMNEADVLDGLLPEDEIEKLRVVLKDGFKDNKTIKEIEKEISEKVDLKDRIKEGQVVLTAASRPNIIARTETVRLANEGLVDMYKEHKVEKVRFLSALSDRTCPICEALNGQVFDINQLNVGESQPPIHVACRCSLVGIVE